MNFRGGRKNAPREENFMGAVTPAILALDIGTGSVRAGVIDLKGRILARSAVAHDTHFPRHGWVEQAPQAWWAGVKTCLRGLLQGLERDHPEAALQALVCCGQMHAPVLVDAAGDPVQHRVPLWNDKRAFETAAEINARIAAGDFPAAINSATTAWPGIKLLWLSRHDPDALARAATLLMPKDYVNLRLTGQHAMDWSEAGSSFLSDPSRGSWSEAAAQSLGLDPALLPPLHAADSILGTVTAAAAAETGLPEGLPVLTGTGDYPCALLGSGVTQPGQVSDITGTSFLLTTLTPRPLCHPQVMNLAMTPAHWGAFAVVDAAGDAIRWAQRTLDRGQRDYAALSEEAATVPAGADGLIFLPYLTGERLGRGEASRAGFLGLTAAHGPAHLHRAVMEGVVLAMQDATRPIREAFNAPDQIIAAAGGARSDLWLQIKANVFDAAILPTVEPESGLIGCACLGFAALGHFASPVEAAGALVRHREPILPDPAEVARYADLAALFTRLRLAMEPVNDLVGKNPND